MRLIKSLFHPGSTLGQGERRYAVSVRMFFLLLLPLSHTHTHPLPLSIALSSFWHSTVDEIYRQMRWIDQRIDMKTQYQIEIILISGTEMITMSATSCFSHHRFKFCSLFISHTFRLPSNFIFTPTSPYCNAVHYAHAPIYHICDEHNKNKYLSLSPESPLSPSRSCFMNVFKLPPFPVEEL